MSAAIISFNKPNMKTSTGVPPQLKAQLPSAWALLPEPLPPTLTLPPPYMEEAITKAPTIDASLRPPARLMLSDMVQTGREANQRQNEIPIECFLKGISSRVAHVYKRRIHQRSLLRSSEARQDEVVQMVQSMFMAAYLELHSEVTQKDLALIRQEKERIKHGEPGQHVVVDELDTSNWPNFSADIMRARGAYHLIRNWQDKWMPRAQNTCQNLALTRLIPDPIERLLAGCTYHYDPPRMLDTKQLPIHWQAGLNTADVIVHKAAHVGQDTMVTFVFALAPGDIYNKISRGAPDVELPLSMPQLASPHQRMAEAATQTIHPALPPLAHLRRKFIMPPPILPASETNLSDVMEVSPPPPLPPPPIAQPVLQPPEPIPTSPLKRKASDDGAAIDEPPAKRVFFDEYVLSDPPHMHGSRYVPFLVSLPHPSHPPPRFMDPLPLIGMPTRVLVCTPMLSALVRIGLFIAADANRRIAEANPDQVTARFQASILGFDAFVQPALTAAAGGPESWTKYMRTEWGQTMSTQDRSDYGLALCILVLFVLERPADAAQVENVDQRAVLFGDGSGGSAVSEYDDKEEDDFLFGDGTAAGLPPPPSIELPATISIAHLSVVLGGVLGTNPGSATARYLATFRQDHAGDLYGLDAAVNTSQCLGLINYFMSNYMTIVKNGASTRCFNTWLYLAALIVICFDPERTYRVVRIAGELEELKWAL